MIAYKVLDRRPDGKLYSAGNIPLKLRQTYQVGVKNRPKIKGSFIFVFTNLAYAEEFRDTVCSVSTVLGDAEIWEVETNDDLKNIHRLPSFWSVPYELKEADLKIVTKDLDWWWHKAFGDGKNQWTIDNEMNYLELGGTVGGVSGAKYVKLIKKI